MEGPVDLGLNPSSATAWPAMGPQLGVFTLSRIASSAVCLGQCQLALGVQMSLSRAAPKSLKTHHTVSPAIDQWGTTWPPSKMNKEKAKENSWWIWKCLPAVSQPQPSRIYRTSSSQREAAIKLYQIARHEDTIDSRQQDMLKTSFSIFLALRSAHVLSLHKAQLLPSPNSHLKAFSTVSSSAQLFWRSIQFVRKY